MAFAVVVSTLAAATVGGCVSAPRAIAPTAWTGPVAVGPVPVGAVPRESVPGAPASGGSVPACSATPAPNAVEGPLRLDQPALVVLPSGDAFRWQLVIDNPWHAAFEVELVVTVTAADGMLLATDGTVLRLPGRERRRVEGAGALPATPRPIGWRIEYWSRPLAPPGQQVIRRP